MDRKGSRCCDGCSGASIVASKSHARTSSPGATESIWCRCGALFLSAGFRRRTAVVARAPHFGGRSDRERVAFQFVKVGIAMHKRLLALLTLMLVGGVLFFSLPLVGFSRFATAVESDNTVALRNRIDPNHLRRLLAPQIVWTYLEKTGRMNVSGRRVSSLVAGASASLADPLVGELVTPEALVSLLANAQLNSGNLRFKAHWSRCPKVAWVHCGVFFNMLSTALAS